MTSSNHRWNAGILRGRALTRRMLAEEEMKLNPSHVSDEALLHYQRENHLLEEASREGQ